MDRERIRHSKSNGASKRSPRVTHYNKEVIVLKTNNSTHERIKDFFLSLRLLK